MRYRDEFAAQAAEMTRAGTGCLEIAGKLGISMRDMERFQKEHPEFAEALSVDHQIELSLVRRALGLTYEEIYLEENIDRQTGEVTETLKRKTVRKSVPPDIRAVLFYLKNRLPERWKEKEGDCEGTEEPYSFDGDEAEL